MTVFEDATQSGAINSGLPVLDTLIKNGQPTFGVFAGVKRINYLDYHSHLISQKPLTTWRKDFKANQFAFIQIVQPPYRICIAFATIKVATTAFVYLYDEDSQQMEIGEAIRPLKRDATFDGDHYQGQMAFDHPHLKLALDFSPAQVDITLDNTTMALSATLTRYQQPLAICTPAGRRGWTFTQKEPFQTVSGQLTIKPKSKFYNNSPEEVLEFDQQALANLDWTLGYMRHETNWFWSCINTHLPDGRQFLLNLSMGVNETGASENSCWLDGQIHYLPPVMFSRGDSYNSHKQGKSKRSATSPWRIQHQNLGWSNVDIELTFTPLRVYKKTDNYGVIASIFEQWLGEYSGEIRWEGEVVKLDKVMGLAEDHFAKW